MSEVGEDIQPGGRQDNVAINHQSNWCLPLACLFLISVKALIDCHHQLLVMWHVALLDHTRPRCIGVRNHGLNALIWHGKFTEVTRIVSLPWLEVKCTAFDSNI